MYKNVKFNGVSLTKEQTMALNCGVAGDDLKVEAYAGSGKTFFLKVLSHALKKKGKKGLYIAYNKSVAIEAEAEFPSNVRCRTAHSLAYGKVGYKFKGRIAPNINGGILSQYVSLGSEKLLSITAKGNLALDTIEKFCQSADKAIKANHVPFLDLDEKTDTESQHIKEERKEIARIAKKIWNLMKDPNGAIPITHSVYLKLWGLNDPYLDYDFILFDEAQDANGVMLEIIQQQLQCQRIYVGDRFQQIYAWNGAINAMDKIKTVNTCKISQSFRFGKTIADKANEVLNFYLEPKPRVNIKGNLATKSSLEHIPLPDAILCRTNGMVIAKTIELLGKHQVYINGGVATLTALLKGAEALKSGKKASTGELALFQSWEELKEYSESASGGGMKSLVNMVEKHGTRKLINTLYQTAKSPSQAQVTITTVHKAKGAEWRKVKLAGDFKFPKDKNSKIPSEEIHILYVALTRALEQLDVEDCKAANPWKLPGYKDMSEDKASSDNYQHKENFELTF